MSLVVLPAVSQRSEEAADRARLPALPDLEPPALVCDEPLAFYNAWREGLCQLRVFRAAIAGPRFVALLTQESGKSGWSLTNGIETAVSQACQLYGFDPAEVWWIEHYDDRKASPRYRQVLEDACERTNGELFRRVAFASFPADVAPRFPRWTTVKKATVETWIGHALP